MAVLDIPITQDRLIPTSSYSFGCSSERWLRGPALVTIASKARLLPLGRDYQQSGRTREFILSHLLSVAPDRLPVSNTTARNGLLAPRPRAGHSVPLSRLKFMFDHYATAANTFSLVCDYALTFSRLVSSNDMSIRVRVLTEPILAQAFRFLQDLTRAP